MASKASWASEVSVDASATKAALEAMDGTRPNQAHLDGMGPPWTAPSLAGLDGLPPRNTDCNVCLGFSCIERMPGRKPTWMPARMSA